MRACIASYIVQLGPCTAQHERISMLHTYNKLQYVIIEGVWLIAPQEEWCRLSQGGMAMFSE